MKTIRIHLEDLSYVDYAASDDQIEEFRSWLRFANQTDTFHLAVLDQKVMRKDIATIETLR